MKLDKDITLYGLVILGGLICLLVFSALIYTKLKPKIMHFSNQQRLIQLPPPTLQSNTSIEAALKQRRSIRTYKNEPLTLKQISQLLWAAQGITAKNGLRTAPSAGGLYPLEIYVVTQDVTDLPSGVYHYLPKQHALVLHFTGDKSTSLASTSPQSDILQQAKAILVITAIYKRTTAKYGDRGTRYVDMEAGHVAENISLQAVSLGLGTVTMGAFQDEVLKTTLHLPQQEVPLYIMPLGKI